MPNVFARVLTHASSRLGRLKLENLRVGRIGSALSMKAFVQNHQITLHEASRRANRTVSLSRWMKNSLELNNVPTEKLFICSHGVGRGFFKSKERYGIEHSDLRLGILGRADPAKGFHIAVKGFRRLPADAQVKLYLHPMNSGKSGQVYLRNLEKLSAGDSRIEILLPVERLDLPGVLHNFDVLLVPSICMETGPLVILEAFASGIPVFGSNLGGIAEHIQDGINL